MTIINVKGREIKSMIIKDSFHRRAIQFRNNIIQILGKIGIKEDDVDIPIEIVANKNSPAEVSWFFGGFHLHYSYSKCTKFVENLYIIQELLQLEIDSLISEEKTPEQFIEDFREETDIKEQRQKARETLGLDVNEKDISVIDKAYKDLAKEHHPDKLGGDTTKFKEINTAHKILKRELI